MVSPRLSNALIGAAGEYHVAAQLSARGWLATVTIKNAPGTDILAQHEATQHLVAIQTKTTSLAGDSLVLGEKDERPDLRDLEWYVFVLLGRPEERPIFYVVPRNHVAALLWVGHRNWLATPGRGGRIRKDNSMRNVFPRDIEGYREQWDALLRPPSEMRPMLPDWVEERQEATGLPPRHPGL